MSKKAPPNPYTASAPAASQAKKPAAQKPAPAAANNNNTNSNAKPKPKPKASNPYSAVAPVSAPVVAPAAAAPAPKKVANNDAEDIFFSDAEQEEAYKQIVEPAVSEILDKYTESAKSDFQKQLSQLKWHQQVRGWTKSLNDLPSLSTSQREDDSFYKNLYFYYMFSNNNVERFSKAFKVLSGDAPVKVSKQDAKQQAPNQRYWQSSGKTSKTNKAFLRKMVKDGNDKADGEDEDFDMSEAKPVQTSKKRKLDELDFEYNKPEREAIANKEVQPKKKQKLQEKLAKLQEEEEELQEAEREGNMDARASKKLESALKKAAGKRDNDNIKVVKNKLKKEQSKKKKSKQEWAAREKKVEQDKERRREKKDENRKNKRTRGKKGAQDKGGVKKKRPGFEGKRTRPINQKHGGKGGDFKKKNKD